MGYGSKSFARFLNWWNLSMRSIKIRDGMLTYFCNFFFYNFQPEIKMCSRECEKNQRLFAVGRSPLWTVISFIIGLPDQLMRAILVKQISVVTHCALRLFTFYCLFSVISGNIKFEAYGLDYSPNIVLLLRVFLIKWTFTFHNNVLYQFNYTIFGVTPFKYTLSDNCIFKNIR